MNTREAQIADLPAIMEVRLAVNENRLSDPTRVTEADYTDYITRRGKGWVCEMDNRIVGFAIADLEEHNIWALFILPGFEGMGIGRRLQQDMLNWYFSNTSETVWLSTAAGTRAEGFYRKTGWREAGMYSAIEIKFEMSADEWEKATKKPFKNDTSG